MIESFLTSFAVGSIGFWILAVIASIVFTICVELDKLGSAIFATCVLGFIYFKSLHVLFASPTTFAICCVVWVVIGVFWSCWRWLKYVRETISNKTIKDSDDKRYVENDLDLYKHKSRIIGWIVYWPWSMIWNIVGDFFEALYKSMEGLYTKITESQLNKIQVTDKPDRKK